MASNKQPWIHSKAFDLGLIIGPAVLALITVLILNSLIPRASVVGPLAWFALVVCVDVAHVYSSLFRTYADRSMQGRDLLWMVPVACWVVGSLLYSLDARYFWTALAYFAVFHFVRQQYGFAMVYARFEKDLPRSCRQIDRFTIYAATLYPLIFWHTHLPRRFNWFIEGDFIGIDLPWLDRAAGALYALTLLTYTGKEIWLWSRHRQFNVPRNLLILTTVLSWFIGIVWLNNDLAFTLTNVVSHGLPYVALVWLYGRKNQVASPLKIAGQSLFRLRMIPIFLGVLILLAYLEEGLWDGFVWRDHARFFPLFSSLPQIQNHLWLALFVPLLALPQSTHYLFDAFLWRVTGPQSGWKHVIMGTGSPERNR